MICGSEFTSNKVVSGPPTDDTYRACGSELFVNPANAWLKATVKGIHLKTASAALDWNIYTVSECPLASAVEFEMCASLSSCLAENISRLEQC